VRAQDEIYNDFKYWEDASDQFRDGEGSLLPLWRFADNKTRRKQVTSLAWNPQYKDMFAVGYGTYDFMKQGSGLICVYSLKNASHPEYSFTTESGVMSLDFHPQVRACVRACALRRMRRVPRVRAWCLTHRRACACVRARCCPVVRWQHPALLSVGCYDGTVKVFDIRKKENTHIFMSDIKTGKHTDPVWQVRWQAEDLAKDMSFFSVSSDGRVASWALSKNELKMEPVMILKLASSQADAPDEETSLTGAVLHPRSVAWSLLSSLTILPGNSPSCSRTQREWDGERVLCGVCCATLQAWPAAAASTSARCQSTCSSWVRRRARSTSAPRRTAGSTS
jgi:dynein intermediate chain 1